MLFFAEGYIPVFEIPFKDIGPVVFVGKFPGGDEDLGSGSRYAKYF